MECIGFDPFIFPDSRLLILGSFPSVKSRQEGFYYGNKQNRFWRVLADFFGMPVPQTVAQKQAMLRAHRIALWDIVTECEIRGSMDKDIVNPRIADVPALLTRYPVRSIFTNGATAHKLLLRNFPQLSDITTPLPSTSPANVRFDAAVWQQALRSAL